METLEKIRTGLLYFRLWRKGGLPLPIWLKSGRVERVKFISQLIIYFSGQKNTIHETQIMQESWLSI